jgi:hypothetical protein
MLRFFSCWSSKVNNDAYCSLIGLLLISFGITGGRNAIFDICSIRSMLLRICSILLKAYHVIPRENTQKTATDPKTKTSVVIQSSCSTGTVSMTAEVLFSTDSLHQVLSLIHSSHAFAASMLALFALLLLTGCRAEFENRIGATTGCSAVQVILINVTSYVRYNQLYFLLFCESSKSPMTEPLLLHSPHNLQMSPIQRLMLMIDGKSRVKEWGDCNESELSQQFKSV